MDDTTAGIATTQVPDKPHRLKSLDRISVIMPPEAQLPINERVYAMDVQIIEDPILPTMRDLALVERLGSLMCEAVEVIAITGLGKKQFQDNESIKHAWARGRERAKTRLRLMQWDAAAMGSERMLVHLGKQYLDQSEKTESNNLDADQRKEKQVFRDKLADAIDRAAEKRVVGVIDGGRATESTEDVDTVGAGQPAPATR